MRRGLALLAVCAAFWTLPTERAGAQTALSFDFFYHSLIPYGQWVQVTDYGYCWRPSNVGPEWRPYADGFWVYTDNGWTWNSYEDYGWITYHYGRWMHLQNFGWVWWPDPQWGPAWVSWRSGDEYIGWAPLPPQAQLDVEIDTGCDATYDIGPGIYNFCNVAEFGSPVLLPVLFDPLRNAEFIDRTRNVTHIYRQDGAVFDGGPDFTRVSARTTKAIPSLRLIRNTDPNIVDQTSLRAGLARTVGNQLIVSAPYVAPASEEMRPETVAQTVPAPQVDRGWGGVSDGAMQTRVRAVFAQERILAAQRAAASGAALPNAPTQQQQTRQVFNEVVPATRSVEREEGAGPGQPSFVAHGSVVAQPRGAVEAGEYREARPTARSVESVSHSAGGEGVSRGAVVVGAAGSGVSSGVTTGVVRQP